MRHKHYDCIVAWAEAPDSSYQWRLHPTDKWIDVEGSPAWTANEYRIKPQPKPDVVRYVNVYISGMLGTEVGSMVAARNNLSSSGRLAGMLKYTLDGETGQLKSVEIVREGGD